MQGNQFRKAPSGAAAPPMQGGQSQHSMQQGLMTPVEMQHSFMVDTVSKMDGRRYQGQFTVRKLSIRDISQIGVRKCQLNGGYHYDDDHPGTGVPPETDWLNQMIAYIETVVIQSPAWFDLDKLYDAALLGEVFKNASEYETTFFALNGARMLVPEAAKMIGAERVRNPQLLDLLKRWWEEKFRLPWSHELAQNQTVFELLIDFWEDHYVKNPLDAKRTASGDVFFTTGDPLIDKWEREIALGIEPDLLEGRSPEERKQEEKALKSLVERKRQRGHPDAAKLSDGFTEDYSESLSELPVIGSGTPSRGA